MLTHNRNVIQNDVEIFGSILQPVADFRTNLDKKKEPSFPVHSFGPRMKILTVAVHRSTCSRLTMSSIALY